MNDAYRMIYTDSVIGIYKTWKIEFNTGKCNIMNYGPTNNKCLDPMDGTILEITKEEKDFGSALD